MPEPRPFSKLAEKLIGDFRRLPRMEPEKMRRRPTKAMSELIEELATKHHLGRTSPEDAIRERWSELVGPANASYSHAVRIERDRRLIVMVTHAVVRNELFLNRAEIIARIQKIPGCPGVKELRVVAG